MFSFIFLYHLTKFADALLRTQYLALHYDYHIRVLMVILSLITVQNTFLLLVITKNVI